jgi:hypothetical protein
LVFAFTLSGISIARAAGTTRIQHRGGDITEYRHVRVTIGHRALRLTSTDGKGVLAIAIVGCVKTGELHRCQPGGAEYRRNGEVRALDIISGTLYFNLTDQNQALPLSSTQVPPHGVILALRTVHDTYLSATAKIDGFKK